MPWNCCGDFCASFGSLQERCLPMQAVFLHRGSREADLHLQSHRRTSLLVFIASERPDIPFDYRQRQLARMPAAELVSRVGQTQVTREVSRYSKYLVTVTLGNPPWRKPRILDDNPQYKGTNFPKFSIPIRRDGTSPDKGISRAPVLPKTTSKQYKMDSQNAKKSPSHLDLTRAGYQGKNGELISSTICPPQFDMPFDEAATKKLVRKLDLHLIPFLAFIYL